MRSTSLGSEGCFDLIRIALLETTVEMAFKPAARIVSPDSTRSTMPSATPSAHAASTLPPTYLMFVFSLASLATSPLVWPLCSASSLRKYCSARFVKEVTTFLPIRSSGLARSPFCGTWTCRSHLPKSRSRTSTTPVVAVGGTAHSCSSTWSRPVIPRSTRPSPTKVGISAAGRKTSARGRFLTSAMSRREWRWNWMSEPWRRSRQTWWRRPSGCWRQKCRVYGRRCHWIGGLTLGHREEQAVVEAVAQCVSHERQAATALARSLHDELQLLRAIDDTIGSPIGERHGVNNVGGQKGNAGLGPVGTYELTRSIVLYL